MPGTYDEGLCVLRVEPLHEDVLRAALPQIEQKRATVWRPGAWVTPALVGRESASAYPAAGRDAHRTAP